MKAPKGKLSGDGSTQARRHGGAFGQWRSQPKNFGGGKMFDFRRVTLFCLEKRFSKHKITIFSKNFGGPWPHWPPTRYAYALGGSYPKSFL